MLFNLFKKTGGTADPFCAKFRIDEIPPFFQQVAPLIEPDFGEAQADRICAMAKRMEHGEEREFKFSLPANDGSQTIRIILFRHEIDSLDLYIFANAPLLARIRAAFWLYRNRNTCGGV